MSLKSTVPLRSTSAGQSKRPSQSGNNSTSSMLVKPLLSVAVATMRYQKGSKPQPNGLITALVSLVSNTNSGWVWSLWCKITCMVSTRSSSGVWVSVATERKGTSVCASMRYGCKLTGSRICRLGGESFTTTWKVFSSLRPPGSLTRKVTSKVSGSPGVEPTKTCDPSG